MTIKIKNAIFACSICDDIMCYLDNQLWKKLNLCVLMEANENILCKNQIRIQIMCYQFRYEQLHISSKVAVIKLVEALTSNNMQITAELLNRMYKSLMWKLHFLNSLEFNNTQTSSCTLKLFHTQSIKNDKSFLKQKIHILYIQRAII